MNALNALLKRHESLFNDFFAWLSATYDAESGGFYYAHSSVGSSEFQPDIESTAQGINILENENLFNRIPPGMSAAFIRFFQSRQNPDGFFLDPHNEMHTVQRMRARALSYSVGALRKFGAQPLFPLPGEGGEASLPDYMRSLPEFEQWLQQRPWDYAWMACDNISASSVYIRSLPSPEREKWIDYLLNWLTERQDPETGFWGEGRPYVRLSGAFKLGLMYRALGVEMPNSKKVFFSLLKTAREDTSEDMCWTRNTVDLLSMLRPWLGGIEQPHIPELLEISLTNLSRYKKPDGGFSRHPEHSLAMPNNVVLGLGLAEGDMNAGTQAIRVRRLLYSFAALECPDLDCAGFPESVTAAEKATETV